MKHFVKKIGRAVAGAFGRPTRVLQDFPLELLAKNKRLWVGLLRDAMQKSGRGFRHYTLKRRSPVGASKWRGERRPDKVEAIARAVNNPVFTGKLNYRRTSKPTLGAALLEPLIDRELALLARVARSERPA